MAPGELAKLGEVLFADARVGLVGAFAVELERMRALIVKGLEHKGAPQEQTDMLWELVVAVGRAQPPTYK